MEEFPSFCLLYTLVEAKVSPMVLTLSVSIEWVARSAEQQWPCHRLPSEEAPSAPTPLSGFPASGNRAWHPYTRERAGRQNCALLYFVVYAADLEGRVRLGPKAPKAGGL